VPFSAMAPVGCARLTWSLTPHPPAEEVAARRRRPFRRAACSRRHVPRPCGARDGRLRSFSTSCRLPARKWAGLTSKSHHAQQPRVALRGSFRLRLASTCNHRPGRNPHSDVTPTTPEISPVRHDRRLIVIIAGQALAPAAVTHRCVASRDRTSVGRLPHPVGPTRGASRSRSFSIAALLDRGASQ
jgi:hypothetical protein